MSEGTSKYAIEVQEAFDGVQVKYAFPNGYGASIIRHYGSYGGSDGLFELAVIRFAYPGDYNNWDFVYDSYITDDVIGWLTPEDVDRTLLQIRDLPSA